MMSESWDWERWKDGKRHLTRRDDHGHWAKIVSVYSINEKKQKKAAKTAKLDEWCSKQ